MTRTGAACATAIARKARIKGFISLSGVYQISVAGVSTASKRKRGSRKSERRFPEHYRFQFCLLEVVVCGERLGHAPTPHHGERQAIGQAPILVDPRPVELQRAADQFGLE